MLFIFKCTLARDWQSSGLSTLASGHSKILKKGTEDSKFCIYTVK